MITLIYITYFIHLLWLWGSCTYVIVEHLKNNQGGAKNPVLYGWRLVASFFVISIWFYYILSEANIFHHLDEWAYNHLEKLIKEIFNLLSTIVCSVLLLGIGLKDKK